MEYATIAVTPLAQNCSLLWCPRTLQGAVVDPGGESGRILALARQHGVTVERLLLTHLHIDHVGAAAEVAERTGAAIDGPQAGDTFLLDTLEQQAALFGLRWGGSFTPARWLEPGDRVGFGDVELEVRHCPGHTPGHVVFHHPGRRLAFVGDVLFRGSIGRTDFPGGDHRSLLHSIREQLWPLGDDVTFVAGHGPESTLGEERRTNPFVGDGRS